MASGERGKWLVILAFSLLLPLSTIAGTITFSDLTENPTIIDGTGGRISGSCAGESCTVTITAPLGYSFSSFDVVFGIWTEPDGSAISDTFCIPNNCTSSPGSVFVGFTSDPESSLPDAIGCLTHAASCPAEDGTAQAAGDVFWTNGTNQIHDSILFQSDINDASSVPEPATAWPVLAGVGGLIWRRRKRSADV